MNFNRPRHVRLAKAQDEYIIDLAKRNRTTYSAALRLVVDIVIMQSGGESA